MINKNFKYMRDFLMCTALVILFLCMTAVTLFPIILAFMTGNFFLILLYVVWWVPMFLVSTTILVAVKLIFETW